MILKYAVLVFLILGSMIFAINVMFISESYQAAPNGWVMDLPKPPGTNENLNNLVGLGVIDENTLIETGLKGKPDQTALNSLEIASLSSTGESVDNNSVGNLTFNQTINNTNTTEIQEILNNTDATELNQYISEILKVLKK